MINLLYELEYSYAYQKDWYSAGELGLTSIW